MGGSGTGFCHSVAATEVWAVRDALVACIDIDFDHIIIKSDAKVVIQMLRKEVSYDYNFECILDDIEILARRLTSVTFAFVPRESNRAVH